MKKYVFIAILLIGFYFLFLSVVNLTIAQESQKDTITLESSMGNVTFSHKKHCELDACNKCHHTGMGNPECTTCHSKEAEVNPMNAFHKNCIDCHKEKQAGPVGCGDCHKK